MESGGAGGAVVAFGAGVSTAARVDGGCSPHAPRGATALANAMGEAARIARRHQFIRRECSRADVVRALCLRCPNKQEPADLPPSVPDLLGSLQHVPYVTRKRARFLGRGGHIIDGRLHSRGTQRDQIDSNVLQHQ